MRALPTLLLVLALTSGCQKLCKPGTIYLTLDFDAKSASATLLDVDVSAGGVTRKGMLAHKAGSSSGTVEVDFGKPYPASQAATVSVIALDGSARVGSGDVTATLAAGCSALKITVSSTGSSVSDGGVDLGPACTPTSCAAGTFCVDGVCCSTPCTDQCSACNVPGSVGTCVAVKGAPVGDRQACLGAGTTCGGTCDGTLTTGCTYPGSSTTCDPQSCAGGVKTIAVGCDGMGSCPAAQTVTCTPAMCNASGSDCLSTCTSDSDCTQFAGKPYCNAGACTSTKPNGRTCASGGECNSTNCIDGVCCNEACTEQCQACDVSGSVGTCSPVTSGAPHNVPSSGRSNCGGSSACAGACAAGQALTCTYPTAQCGGGTCSAAMATAAVFCNMGSCPGTPAAAACANHLACNSAMTGCNPGPCNADSDCASGYYCGGSGTCTAQIVKGQQCPASNCHGQSNCDQCATGYCVDGYCCDKPCAGQCQACNLTTGGATPGTCATVAANGSPVAPRTACPTGTPAACDATCNGSDATACHYSTATCVAQSCMNGVVTFATTCSNGACVAPNPPTQTCSGACTNNSCGSCTVDGDCGSGKYCNAGACVATLSNGATCTRATECAQGNCVDGYCCNALCNQGACQNCYENPGTCQATHSGEQPITGHGTTRAQCAGSGSCQEACDGTDITCADVKSGTTCAASSCASTTSEIPPATCSGGSCGSPSAKGCGGYLCSGTACLTTCSSDANCAPGYYCSGTSCVPALTDGQPCTSGDGNQCINGNCVANSTGSGYTCCHTACGGNTACQVCDGTNGNALGTCGPASSSVQCGGSSTCPGTCSGTSSEACTYGSGSCGACHVCSNGSCESLGVSCGSSCCAGSQSCVSGHCCSVPCGTGCCLPTQHCTPTGCA